MSEIIGSQLIAKFNRNSVNPICTHYAQHIRQGGRNRQGYHQPKVTADNGRTIIIQAAILQRIPGHEISTQKKEQANGEITVYQQVDTRDMLDGRRLHPCRDEQRIEAVEEMIDEYDQRSHSFQSADMGQIVRFHLYPCFHRNNCQDRPSAYGSGHVRHRCCP